MKCRFCRSELSEKFVDLGFAPPSNAYIAKDNSKNLETYFPLDVMVCGECFLVQVDEYQDHSKIFNEDYAYFSSFSTSWLEHSKKYVERITERLSLNENSLVCEVASNDGYLLQYFKEKSIPCYGVEPTKSTADVAISKGIKTYVQFFGEDFVNSLSSDKKVDLVLGNNVYAHVPDINDFTKGLSNILKSDGVVTLEFPHLYELIKGNQFDTIYHEHFSYLSLETVKKIFEKNGLKVFDVERIPTHGGSLRVYAQKLSSNRFEVTKAVGDCLKLEDSFGMNNIERYRKFQEVALKIKLDFVDFLIKLKRDNKTVVGYGAAAKGNTLLNYCGVKDDLIDYVCDKSPHKQGTLLPGSHIPVVSPDQIKKDKPAYVVIFPWNIKDEVMEQLSFIKEWGGRFVVAIPELREF